MIKPETTEMIFIRIEAVKAEFEISLRANVIRNFVRLEITT